MAGDRDEPEGALFRAPVVTDSDRTPDGFDSEEYISEEEFQAMFPPAPCPEWCNRCLKWNWDGPGTEPVLYHHRSFPPIYGVDAALMQEVFVDDGKALPTLPYIRIGTSGESDELDPAALDDLAAAIRGWAQRLREAR